MAELEPLIGKAAAILSRRPLTAPIHPRSPEKSELDSVEKAVMDSNPELRTAQLMVKAYGQRLNQILSSNPQSAAVRALARNQTQSIIVGLEDYREKLNHPVILRILDQALEQARAGLRRLGG